MKQEAILLTGAGASSHGSDLAKVLDFFGVPWRSLTPEEFFVEVNAGNENSSKVRLLCSADTFLRVAGRLEGSLQDIRVWSKRVHSVFVYAGDTPGILQNLLRRLTRSDATAIREISSSAGDFHVSEHWNEFCGVMAGLRVRASGANGGTSFILNGLNQQHRRNIISTDHGATFLMIEYENVAVFLSTSESVIDIDSKLTSQNFDIREHFLSAVPVVLYTKWAFADICWNSSEANACVVIDDPLLKPNYGCLNFAELLALMERHQFATNIAFIPWNWRRSDPAVARMFKEKPQRYSLSVHGSDHVAAEFGSRDQEHLRWKVKQAVDRMSHHEASTGISYEKVMVFPQGIFSGAAMDVLKRSNFTAAVNTDVLSVDPYPPAIKISDLWDVAVTRYGSFPFFTRRDPSQEIVNFAFDILVGKPCIVGIHHDFCRDRYKHLLELVDRLNALVRPLAWRSLGEVVKRSFRQRELSPGVLEIEMYGAELRLENHSGQRTRYLIRRRECEPWAIKEIREESGPIAWNSGNGHINFETELGPGVTKMVGIRFHELEGNGRNGGNAPYRFKTMLRRYLSEVRDNYIVKNKIPFPGFRW